jgi:hypothetical protein
LLLSDAQEMMRYIAREMTSISSAGRLAMLLNIAGCQSVADSAEARHLAAALVLPSIIDLAAGAFLDLQAQQFVTHRAAAFVILCFQNR